MANLRPARASDHELYLRLFPELGVDDPPADAERWARELAPDAHVLEDEGEAVGYVLLQVLHGIGYVRQVVIDPRARGRGLGGEAMRAAAAVLIGAGCRAWCLNVKPANEPAVRLYRGCGMVERYRTTCLRWRWALLDELAEALTEDVPTSGTGDAGAVRCAPVDPAGRRAVEERFALPAGLLASLATQGRVRLVAAHRARRIVGVASFDPVVPGCFPFRADDLAVALALLAALRPHAAPDARHLQLVVEDAPQLVVALEQVGAIRVLELAHYRGELGQR